MPSLSDAYNYVIAACNWPYIGYSQGAARETIDINATYRTYCDCSSLMSKALTVGGYFVNNPWFVTRNEDYYLKKAGWQTFDINGTWQPGDILWRDGHTEMVYTGGDGSGVTMGAHTARYDFERQVSINTYTSSASAWSILYRDPTQSVVAYKWYQVNDYLPEYGDEMTGNAYMVFSFFTKLGFTNEAIAGLLGNMQAESGINPGRWQNGSGPGYGLVQWDPASNYLNWAAGQGIDINDADSNGDGQCTLINLCESVGQWLPNSSHGYTYTWAQFAALTDVDTAVYAFLWQYERPSVPHTENRITYAHYWYDIISSGAWGAGDPGAPSGRPGVQNRGAIAELQRRLVIPGRH